MAKLNVPQESDGKKLEIGNNIGATLRFSDDVGLSNFAKAQSDRLASLLCVLKDCAGAIDEMYLVDVLQISSDMAYELKQAVELMNERELVHV